MRTRLATVLTRVERGVIERGPEESVSNDDVSIVCARKCEMDRMK